MMIVVTMIVVIGNIRVTASIRESVLASLCSTEGASQPLCLLLTRLLKRAGRYLVLRPRLVRRSSRR